MIRVLEKNVADKIAAGEVIERPVSIVKELVENSIDSGADSIIVEIKNGGKSYIRVTDNGCGISRNEVETAFLRHATSKIETAKDLNAIETLGFRGEALASIAAVTHTELVTKTREAKVGTKLLIHGSEVLSNSGTGCPDGTTIIITDLFYNTPARQKFLKSDSAESGQIIDFMSQIALAYPNIRFRFINNGNIAFSTTGKGDILNAILSVYKLSEYKDLVAVDHRENAGSITGYISKPSLSRTTRRNQIFFVNGRVVASKVIERGVTEGYKERLFEGRYPVAFLFIFTDPERLDVNIHPNKREVRFDNENEIIELVSHAVKETLGTKAAVIEAKDIFKDEVSTPIKSKDRAENQIDIKQILSTKRELPQVKETLRPYQETRTEEQKQEQPLVKEEREQTLPQKKAEISIEKPFLQPFDFDELELTGAIFGTYITAVDEKNFYLIDQHAAHERVFYEKLVSEYLTSEKVRQPILTPIIIEAPLAVKENEYDWLDSLTEMGFTIEDFGQNSYVIREIPTFMDLSEAEDFVKIYIDNVTEGTNLNNTVVINKLITKSCKSAIKAHDYISMEEMKALLDQLKRCRNPFSCPHGRPTFIKFSQYEIERMFKRA
ncbi:DNA mismatch repair endonuclease MutL [Emergencia sp.]|uniref:DNA mismatch repair endonuclease MutL n=1 Tax=Emergencia sp. TaxID=1926557 RepID=UPI003AF02A9A